jgi:murein L,D-transpeptidase YafK
MFRNAIAGAAGLVLISASAGAQQQQQQQVNTCPTLLGLAVINNDANTSMANDIHRQLETERKERQEKEKAMADYWAAWAKGDLEKAAAIAPHHDEEEKPL